MSKGYGASQNGRRHASDEKYYLQESASRYVSYERLLIIMV